MEVQFVNIIQKMSLTHLQTAALRLAIAKDDSIIRHALDRFRVDRNESALNAALRTVIDRTIDENRDGAADSTGPSASASAATKRSRDDEEDEDDDTVDYYGTNDFNYESYSKAAGSSEGIGDEADDEEEEDDDDDDEEEEEEDDDDEEDDDEEEEGIKSLSSSAHRRKQLISRETVFPLLLSELSKENILNADQVKNLNVLYQKNDSVLTAALDVYDEDHDMTDLVDMLQQLSTLSDSRK